MLAKSAQLNAISSFMMRYQGVWFLLFIWTVLQYIGGLNGWDFSRPEIDAGQYWRMFSAHFVHLNTMHLVMNTLGLLAIVSVWGSALSGWRTLWLSLLLAPMMSIALWINEPQLQHYAGASGVLHGLFAAGLILAFDVRLRWRLLAALGLCAKLWLETQVNTGSAALIGAPVIHAAHQWGALFGGLTAAIYAAIRILNEPEDV